MPVLSTVCHPFAQTDVDRLVEWGYSYCGINSVS